MRTAQRQVSSRRFVRENTTRSQALSVRKNLKQLEKESTISVCKKSYRIAVAFFWYCDVNNCVKITENSKNCSPERKMSIYSN